GDPAGVPVPDGAGQQGRERQGVQRPVTATARERLRPRSARHEKARHPAGFLFTTELTSEAGSLTLAGRRAAALGRGGRALGGLGRALGLVGALGLRPCRTLLGGALRLRTARALVRRTLGVRARGTLVGGTLGLRARRALALALQRTIRTRLALHVGGTLGHLGATRTRRLALGRVVATRLLAPRALAGAQRLGGFLLQTLHALAEFLLHLRQGDRAQADLLAEDVDFLLGHFAPAAHGQLGGEEYRSEAHALEAADHHALGFPQTPHLAVATFHHHYVEPAIQAVAARGFLDVGELGGAVFQHDAGLEGLDHLLGDFPAHAHGVLAVHLVGGMHHAVGQFAVGGEQQQPGGVEVEAADVDPAAALQARQAVEHGR